MASNRNLQATLNWCLPFISFQPVTIGGVDPAITIANMVAQTMMGPPFCWRWNRATTSFVCIPSPVTTDYLKTLTDFGFIEKAWYQAVSGDKKEMTVQLALAQTTEVGRPEYIAAQKDDDNGGITFRVNTAPVEAGSVFVDYQKKPVELSSNASTWAPIPDELAYIYHWGFLALAAILHDDERFPIFNQKFTAHLLGAQAGLDEMQRNLFLGNWLLITKQLERAQLKTNQGTAALQQ